MPSRSPPARANRDRSGAGGPCRSRGRECETPPRSLSSVGRIPGGPRRSRPIRGRPRCCIVCGPARCRCPRDGPARRRNRRTDPPRHPIGRSADGLSGFRRQRLFSAAVFASSVSFRAGPSVFKDPGKLSFDYLPDKLVHREKQTQRLFSLLRPIVEAGASSNAFLYGAVGTGKTHTAKRFCLDFRKYASESDRAVDWDVVKFPRYDRTELEDIVQGRVALAMHPGTVDDDLIDLIADIASEFGDARYAIELLEKAGMLADEERAEEVAAEHVRGAKSHVHP